MDIVYLHQYFTTPQMPGGTRSFELARRLVEAGHRVRMVTSDQSAVALPSGEKWRTSMESGIEVHWTPVAYSGRMSPARRIGSFFQFATRASARAASLGGDVVFATSTPLTIALPAVYAAKRLRVPMVFEVRDLWPAVPIAMGVIRNPLLCGAAEWLERFAYRNAARVVALAPGMKDHVVEKGYPAERVEVIPNGADIALFSSAAGQGARIRAQTPWLLQRPLVLYCGAIGKVNGVDRLARIAAAVQATNPDVRFVVIGGGPEEPRVRQVAAEAGVLDRSFFMIGPVAKREVPAWLDAADLAIALIQGPEILWKHATQNKFFDALAAAKPILSNFRGWQSIQAEEAGAGIIFDADVPSDAARDILSLLRDRKWLDTAGRAARDLAVSRFDRDEHARVLERVLLDAIASPARA